MTNDKMTTDHQLVRETLRGNQLAFQALVERYQDYVFSVTLKILKKREEAEEAAQDAFVKAYRALGSFEQRSKFATWLYQIAWRTAIDKYRSRPAASQSLDDEKSFLQISDGAATPFQKTKQKNTAAIVRLALAKMKPEDASLLTLYYLNEQSVKEISEIMGLSVSNVKVKLFRLRSTLKKILEKNLKHEIKDLI